MLRKIAQEAASQPPEAWATNWQLPCLVKGLAHAGVEVNADASAGLATIAARLRGFGCLSEAAADEVRAALDRLTPPARPSPTAATTLEEPPPEPLPYPRPAGGTPCHIRGSEETLALSIQPPGTNKNVSPTTKVIVYKLCQHIQECELSRPTITCRGEKRTQ